MLGEALIVLLLGTIITWEMAVNHHRTQLNDALIEYYRAEIGPLTIYWKVIEDFLG